MSRASWSYSSEEKSPAIHGGDTLLLAGTIFSMYDVFCSKLKKKAGEAWSHVPHTISYSLTILLRLYEQALAAGNNEIADRCLDAWDILYQNRIGIVRDLTQAIDL